MDRKFLEALPSREDAQWVARQALNSVQASISNRVQLATREEREILTDFFLKEANVSLPLPVLVRLLLDDKKAAESGLKLA